MFTSVFGQVMDVICAEDVMKNVEMMSLIIAQGLFMGDDVVLEHLASEAANHYEFFNRLPQDCEHCEHRKFAQAACDALLLDSSNVTSGNNIPLPPFK